jgi:hypothetical protein
MRRKREPLSCSTQLWIYLGATLVLSALILVGWRIERNVALPAFLLFLLLITVMGARQERAERAAGEAAADETAADESAREVGALDE